MKITPFRPVLGLFLNLLRLVTRERLSASPSQSKSVTAIQSNSNRCALASTFALRAKVFARAQLNVLPYYELPTL